MERNFAEGIGGALLAGRPEVLEQVNGLYATCIDVKPVTVSGWSGENLGDGYRDIEDGPTWQAWGAERCEGCKRVRSLAVGEGNCPHSELSARAERRGCEGHIGIFEGPMMNYWYPLGENITGGVFDEFDPAAAARKLVDLPLCVVEVDGEYGLALTGGGMDFSWEICRGYIALGYLPPLHFCRDLPGMAGYEKYQSTRLVLAAAARAVDIASSQLDRVQRSIVARANDVLSNPEGVH